MSDNRESWLQAGAQALRALVFPDTMQPPRVWLSVGFPKAAKGRGKAIGQCWDGALSTDKAPHVFIHPTLMDPAAVLTTLTHELVHATVGVEHGHRGAFITLAREVGLCRPWTQTPPGPVLLSQVEDIARVLGPYEHAGLDAPQKPKSKNRNRLWTCACGPMVAGHKIRAASDELEVICLKCGEQFKRA
jgi:hypothetical protein